MCSISIIVPVYNAEKYIDKCICSIISQTYNDWELLLVNDGSQDNTFSICEYYSKIDSRIKVFDKKNGGVSSARNIGLAHANGEWIMFVDADDWISEDCLAVCFNEVNANQLDAVQFSHTLVYHDGTIIKQNKVTTPVLSPDQYLEFGVFNVCAGGGLYRFNIIQNNSLIFPINLKLAEDQMFILNFMKYASTIKFIGKPMYFYYQNESSAVHNQKGQDLIQSCNALIDMSMTWPPVKKFVDTMCLVFITDMLRSKDVSFSKIKEVYERCLPVSIYKTVPKSTICFFRLSVISPFIAMHVLSCYFRLFA